MPAVKTQAVQHDIPDAENPLVVSPQAAAHALDGFHAPAREWFRASFAAPTRPQALGWPLIQSGASTLILSPTRSGKTLTAFLSAIDRCQNSLRDAPVGASR
jgi:ATP-dependent helicase Lhr and Lhr-like helicase